MRSSSDPRNVVGVATLSALLGFSLCGWAVTGVVAHRASQTIADAQDRSAPMLTAAVESIVIKRVVDGVGTATPATAEVSVQPGRVVTSTSGKLLTSGKAGESLFELDGRPVLAVPSQFPFWRDLGPGDEGPDVRVLQEMLRTRGYSVTNSGRFTTATATALRRLYKLNGYSPAVRPVETPGAVMAARNDSAGTSQRGEAVTTAMTSAAEETYLPKGEVVAVPPGLSEYKAVGTKVGTVTNAETPIFLNTAGTRVTLQDNGRVADQVKGSIGNTQATIKGKNYTLSNVESVEGRTLLNLAEPVPEAESAGRVHLEITLDVTPEPVLAIPKRYLGYRAGKGPIVFVPGDGDDLHEVVVDVGMEGNGYIELKDSTLEEGQIVALPG